MRKVTYGGATSLDNFLARPDGSYDWILWSDEAMASMGEFWQNIDTILMGRKTYEVAAKNAQGAEGAESFAGVHTFVFSKTLKEIPGPNATLVSSDAAEFVRELKMREGKEICLMGGGELARAMFEADLIDEVGFNIHPLLLGAGIPALHPMSHQIDLELLECRAFKNGCVNVRYRVKHQTA